MGDAAQGEPSRHKVFESPFKVQPSIEETKTPDNYRGFPGGEALPPTVKTWRVQKTGKEFGGVVAFSYGIEDSPDAEILTAGFNEGKGNGDAGVSRHGNYLQWGFSAPPSEMTDAGRAFFVNCLAYIHEFDNVAPLVTEQSSHRMDAIRMANYITRIKDEEFFSGAFGKDLMTRYKGDPKGLMQYYKDDYELIRRDKVFVIDQELKALGIGSNRRLSTLERLIALLQDERQAPAARTLLARYTEEQFATPAEWGAWLAKNRARIYFTDVGGYKFKVAPEGYPVVPGRVGVEAPEDRTWTLVYGR